MISTPLTEKQIQSYIQFLPRPFVAVILCFLNQNLQCVVFMFWLTAELELVFDIHKMYHTTVVHFLYFKMVLFHLGASGFVIYFFFDCEVTGLSLYSTSCSYSVKL